MQTLQAVDSPIQLRAKGTMPWKTLVCMENYNIPLATNTTETDTFCGTAVGLGLIKFTPSGSFVFEQFPTDDQVTFDQMLDWQLNRTVLEFKVEYQGSNGSGMGITKYLTGECFVTATEMQGQINDVLKSTYTLTGQGALSTENPDA